MHQLLRIWEPQRWPEFIWINCWRQYWRVCRSHEMHCVLTCLSIIGIIAYNCKLISRLMRRSTVPCIRGELRTVSRVTDPSLRGVYSQTRRKYMVAVPLQMHSRHSPTRHYSNAISKLQSKGVGLWINAEQKRKLNHVVGRAKRQVRT